VLGEDPLPFIKCEKKEIALFGLGILSRTMKACRSFLLCGGTMSKRGSREAK
jgi:hypothetical protein